MSDNNLFRNYTMQELLDELDIIELSSFLVYGGKR